MVATLANAADLAQWANRLDAQGLLPKLIRRLILATVSEIMRLEMRAGEGTRYPGYDGILEVRGDNAFVPAHLSVWEMGVDQDRWCVRKDYILGSNTYTPPLYASAVYSSVLICFI